MCSMSQEDRWVNFPIISKDGNNPQMALGRFWRTKSEEEIVLPAARLIFYAKTERRGVFGTQNKTYAESDRFYNIY